MNLTKTLRSGLMAAAAGAAALTGVAVAQEADVSLQDVLNAARTEREANRRANAEREQRFLAERNRQQARVNQLRGEVQTSGARSDQLDAQFEANETQIGDLQVQLDTESGEFQELFDAARTTANDIAASLNTSIISAQYPGRVEALRELGRSTSLPSSDELSNLYLTIMQEIVAQSEVATFPATVVFAGGERGEETITRIGPFSAFDAEGDYYTIRDNESGASFLNELTRQPQGGAVANAQDVFRYSGDGYTTGTVDPSLGSLFRVALDVPSTRERFDQGRLVGRVIAVIAVLGVIIGLYKWITLLMTSAAVRGQMRKKTPSKSNPLGRVMMAYQSNPNADTETVALKLDDAVLKEVPKLESGLNLVKVLAAVAPLLGLLGTVIGMINTFQAITLFGTGDPQLMASGISEALITTVLGLMAAIPLLLLHAFAAGAARNVTNILEEQSAGMIAEHAEARA